MTETPQTMWRNGYPTQADVRALLDTPDRICIRGALRCLGRIHYADHTVSREYVMAAYDRTFVYEAIEDALDRQTDGSAVMSMISYYWRPLYEMPDSSRDVNAVNV